MDESINRDSQINVAKQLHSPLRASGSFKSTLSGRSTPRSSPSFRRVHSGRNPRKESRLGGVGVQWFRSNRIVYWLLLITLWTYLGFYVQSRWAHEDNGEVFLGFRKRQSYQNSISVGSQPRDLIADKNSTASKNETYKNQLGDDRRLDVVSSKKENVLPIPKLTSKKKSKRGEHGSCRKRRYKRKTIFHVESNGRDEQEPEIPMTNTTYGMLVGPFGSLEDRILEWSPEKRSGTCERKRDFARLVWSRKFLLIFHELSMTGAPLSMMELATELLSCGATVSAVVLSRKGGLMSELVRRRIRVLEDKADFSFKTAMKVDLVIAGSAVCASWIEQYFEYHPAGASQIAWWIMENRREYFNRAKIVLNRVKILIFLSDSQSKQWLTWCKEEDIKLRSIPALVPLSVNDELAFVAGIASSLNTPTFSSERMLEKRNVLRDSVRKEMGLTDDDMLVISLSSINPGKGQLLLLESVRMMLEQVPLQDEMEIRNMLAWDRDQSDIKRRQQSRTLLQLDDVGATPYGLRKIMLELPALPSSLSDNNAGRSDTTHGRKLLSNDDGRQEQFLKLLIGSVGSKSNKDFYVKRVLSFISKHSNLSKSVLWTPSTTRVASLYSAADVYVINSQGLGETFGRVTIEAMAFGLPVLGTDAGGTKEIVDHNITGLLHPTGHPGARVLAQNLRFLLKNQTVRKQMGTEGRKKVERLYLKRHMYERFVQVLVKCMRP